MRRSHSRRRYLGAIGTAGLAGIAGCSNLLDDSDSDDEESTENDSEEENPVGNVDYDNVDGSLEFTAPEEGDEVTSPVEIEFEVENFELRPADNEPEQGAGHLHVIVDEGCIEPSRPIPLEDGYHHLSEGGRETELNLEPGEYALCGQAGDGIHNAYNLTDEITIEVVEAAADANESGAGDGQNGNETEGNDTATNGA